MTQGKSNRGMKIYWTEEMSVGVRDVDRQHKELFCLVNDLMDLVNGRKDPKNIKIAFGFLERYVVDHFGMEEELMTRHAYPGLNAHKEQHQLFIKSFENMKNRYAELGASDALLKILQSQLAAWILTHVKKIDRRFGEFMTEGR